MSLVEEQQGWERFDEALREYALECVEAEFEEAGYVGPPAGTLWAYEYMPAFFGHLDGGVLEDVDLYRAFVREAPEEAKGLIREEAEDRFAWLFQDYWGEARSEVG